jgi:hypothetical protein
MEMPYKRAITKTNLRSRKRVVLLLLMMASDHKTTLASEN